MPLVRSISYFLNVVDSHESSRTLTLSITSTDNNITKTNPNAKYCDVYDDKFEFIKHFDCITDAMNYIGEIENRTYKSMVTYFWRYQNGTIDIILNKYHIKIYRKSREDNDVPSVSKNGNEGTTTIESV